MLIQFDSEKNNYWGSELLLHSVNKASKALGIKGSEKGLSCRVSVEQTYRSARCACDTSQG